jgi:hypothetical protein|uniref:Uncharacterized protein n=2 Tax=Picea TaxID=3328 RepID=A0A117NGT7_PICGL|nr:hypothetical protein ABT39_MTgene5483 [Picea glauca]QHR91546.1 hypothetical protein Q903MT_gene5581 [Picea sitchensis]
MGLKLQVLLGRLLMVDQQDQQKQLLNNWLNRLLLLDMLLPLLLALLLALLLMLGIL